MRYPCLVLLFLFCTVFTKAQNAGFKPAEVKFNPNYAELSGNPTLEELTTLFEQAQIGNCDIYEVYEKIAIKGDNSLQGLAGYLFSNQEKTAKKDFALYALDRIGSPKAYDLIIQYGAKTNHTEHKAAALTILTNSYYVKVSNEELEPTARILPLYEENLQDSLYSELHGRTISEIAKEGLKLWTGEERPLNISGKKELTAASTKKAIWNKEKKIFTFEIGGTK